MKINLKKILCGAIASALLLTQPCVTALADEAEDAAAAAAAAEKQAIYDTPADTNSLTGWPQGPNIYALAGCVMDTESGAILYGKNMNQQLYPASITKLLTTLVALENSELTDTVTFSEDSIAFLEYGDAHIGMKPGEEISMEDALYAVLLASANEVSYAVAESTGINRLNGDYSTFIQEMNDRAVELGCTGSSWVNPNGLHDENHYTTAYDMALIASAVYQEEQFRKMMETYEYRIGFTNITQEERVFQQNHKMLWEGNDYSWELATGGKTGYTDQSGTTLVTMAEDNGLSLACVVLKDYGADAYVDTRAMMEYVFQNFTKTPLAEQELPEEIESLIDEDAYVLLPNGMEFSSLECELSIAESAEDDTTIGNAVFTYEGQIVGKTEVELSETFLEVSGEAQAEVKVNDAKLEDEETETSSLGEKIFTGILIAAGLLILATVLIFVRNYRILQKRKERRRKKRAAMRKRMGERRRRR